MPENWQENGFGIYVHWPFCESKCPYCDFNSHVSQSISHDAWKNAYLQEVKRYGGTEAGRVVRSVYFGGGTPSLMRPDVVAAVLETICDIWPMSNDVEITLEANPSSVEKGRFDGFKAAGVNRVSLGVQALNDKDLKRLGRLHSVDEAKSALATAREVFDRVNFDLIYARQNQSLAQWSEELDIALGYGPEHLSLYQLTIEPGTAFGDRFAAGGLRGLPDEDLAADMFELTQERTASAGLAAYEVSNHAKFGQESAHNLVYWNGGDWIGIGPGAHGRITRHGVRIATEAVHSPSDWLARIDTGRPTETIESLDKVNAAKELLMMGLRTNLGVRFERVSYLGDSFQVAVEDLKGQGLLEIIDDHLVATATGRQLLNAILRDLLPD